MKLQKAVSLLKRKGLTVPEGGTSVSPERLPIFLCSKIALWYRRSDLEEKACLCYQWEVPMIQSCYGLNNVHLFPPQKLPMVIAKRLTEAPLALCSAAGIKAYIDENDPTSIDDDGMEVGQTTIFQRIYGNLMDQYNRLMGTKHYSVVRVNKIPVSAEEARRMGITLMLGGTDEYIDLCLEINHDEAVAKSEELFSDPNLVIGTATEGAHGYAGTRDRLAGLQQRRGVDKGRPAESGIPWLCHGSGCHAGGGQAGQTACHARPGANGRAGGLSTMGTTLTTRDFRIAPTTCPRSPRW